MATRHRRGDEVGWGFASAGALALAFAIWNLAKDGTSFCHPALAAAGPRRLAPAVRGRGLLRSTGSTPASGVSDAA